MCCAKGASGAPGRCRGGDGLASDIRAMDFRILGPLEVRDGSRRLVLGGERQRALLAILLLHRNEVVSADRLIDELWGESPPAGARKTLRAYVSKLRRAMATNGATPAVDQGSEREPGDGVLLTRGHGYVLEVSPGELDLDRFAEAAERGRDALATGRPEDAARLLREALSLWRGPPLAEFTYDRLRSLRSRGSRSFIWRPWRRSAITWTRRTPAAESPSSQARETSSTAFRRRVKGSLITVAGSQVTQR